MAQPGGRECGMRGFFNSLLGVLAIAAEFVLGLALLIGIWRRPVAWATCGLLTLFALAMTLSFVVKVPLSFSVFADAAGALLLALTLS